MLYYLVAPVSVVLTFDTRNERGAQLLEKMMTRFFTHAVEIDAGAVTRNAVERW